MVQQTNKRRTSSSNGSTSGRSTNRTPVPFSVIMRSRVRQPQFYWFLGHVMILYHFIQFHLSIFNVTSQRLHYGRSLLYIIITYGIVLYQFIRSKQLTWGNFISSLKKLDNLQYFTLYLILYLLNVASNGKIILNGGIISPTIFASFHVLNYFKENLLPYLTMIPNRNLISSYIGTFIKNYNEKCLIVAQSWEIILMFRYLIMSIPMIILTIIWNLIIYQRLNGIAMGKLIMVLVYIRFIRWRFLAKKQFATIFNEMIRRFEMGLTQYSNGQFLPIWNQIKQFVIKYMP
ncbi:hypothetical protein MOUN0_G07492 [Monosporozyma unispora]|nr:hypothetical protein C6P44_005297 [Kazachstania unispora]